MNVLGSTGVSVPVSVQSQGPVQASAAAYGQPQYASQGKWFKPHCVTALVWVKDRFAPQDQGPQWGAEIGTPPLIFEKKGWGVECSTIKIRITHPPKKKMLFSIVIRFFSHWI